MTVLRPSLPPLISMTTSTVSLPGWAAKAVLARKRGTTEPTASSEVPWRLRTKNCRRVNIAASDKGEGSSQLVLRHGHDGVGSGPYRFIAALGITHERHQTLQGFRTNLALQEQV